MFTCEGVHGQTLEQLMGRERFQAAWNRLADKGHDRKLEFCWLLYQLGLRPTLKAAQAISIHSGLTVRNCASIIFEGHAHQETDKEGKCIGCGEKHFVMCKKRGCKFESLIGIVCSCEVPDSRSDGGSCGGGTARSQQGGKAGKAPGDRPNEDCGSDDDDDGGSGAGGKEKTKEKTCRVGPPKALLREEDLTSTERGARYSLFAGMTAARRTRSAVMMFKPVYVAGGDGFNKSKSVEVHGASEGNWFRETADSSPGPSSRPSQVILRSLGSTIFDDTIGTKFKGDSWKTPQTRAKDRDGWEMERQAIDLTQDPRLFDFRSGWGWLEEIDINKVDHKTLDPKTLKHQRRGVKNRQAMDEANGKMLADMYSHDRGNMSVLSYRKIAKILDDAVGMGYTDFCARLWFQRLADDLSSVACLPSTVALGVKETAGPSARGVAGVAGNARAPGSLASPSDEQAPPTAAATAAAAAAALPANPVESSSSSSQPPADRVAGAAGVAAAILAPSSDEPEQATTAATAAATAAAAAAALPANPLESSSSSSQPPADRVAGAAGAAAAILAPSGDEQALTAATAATAAAAQKSAPAAPVQTRSRPPAAASTTASVEEAPLSRLRPRPSIVLAADAGAMPIKLEARPKSSHGRGLFLVNGAVTEGQEITSFSGTAVNSSGNKTFFKSYETQLKLEYRDMKRIAIAALVVVKTNGKYVDGAIVHQELLKLALDRMTENPKLSAEELMAEVTLDDIVEKKGLWFFMNDSEGDSKANVAVSVESTPGGDSKVVWRALCSLKGTAETPVELLYRYDFQDVQAPTSTGSGGSESGDSSSSGGALATAAALPAQVMTTSRPGFSGRAGSGVDNGSAADLDSVKSCTSTGVGTGTGTGVCVSTSAGDSPETEATERKPFVEMSETAFATLLYKVILDVSHTKIQETDGRCAAFDRRPRRRVTGKRARKQCLGFQQLTEVQKTKVIVEAKSGVFRDDDDEYIQFAYGPALLVRMLMVHRSCTMKAAQVILDNDCPEFHAKEDEADEAGSVAEGGSSTVGGSASPATGSNSAGGAAGVPAVTAVGTTAIRQLASCTILELQQGASAAKELLTSIANGTETAWGLRRQEFDKGGCNRADLKDSVLLGGLGAENLLIIADVLSTWATKTTMSPQTLVTDVLVPDFVEIMFMQYHTCSREEAVYQLEANGGVAKDVVSHFTAVTTHETIVKKAIGDKKYTPTHFSPDPPKKPKKPKKGTKETAAQPPVQPPVAPDAKVKCLTASPASGSAFVSLSAAVTHMLEAEDAPLQRGEWDADRQGTEWEADLQIGTKAFLASEYCGDATIGHSPRVSADESMRSTATWDCHGIDDVHQLRAAALVHTCKRIQSTPHVEVRIPYGKDGPPLVQRLLHGALVCHDVGQFGPRTALLVTHGITTYAVLVHCDGKVSFRDPHSLQQLNFRNVDHFLTWVGRQRDWGGSPAMPTTYFRNNPVWPASALFSIVIVPHMIKNRTENFTDVNVGEAYEDGFLTALLVAPTTATSAASGDEAVDPSGGGSAGNKALLPSGGGSAGPQLKEPDEAEDWMYRCCFVNDGLLTGGWTEGSVTRRWEETVYVTLLPKCMTASSAVVTRAIPDDDFRKRLDDGRIVWATSLGPRATFVSNNQGRSPCPFCGTQMKWFKCSGNGRPVRLSAKPATLARCSMVCCNYKAVDIAAVVFGEQSSNCGDVFGTDDAQHKGQVFGCQRCPNDVGPVGAKGSGHPDPASGIGRCHLLCAGCQKRASAGLHECHSTPMRKSQEQLWQVCADISTNSKGKGKDMPGKAKKGKRAVNAMLVTQWLSPASAERCIQDAEFFCRFGAELTDREIKAEIASRVEKATEDNGGPLSASQLSEIRGKCNYLTLGDHARGGAVFNYKAGDLAFGCKGYTRAVATKAMLIADEPFPPNSTNFRTQYELFPDGNFGFTCSEQDIPTLSIARKYELCCFKHAIASPDRRPNDYVPVIAGSKILKSGFETNDVSSSGGNDANASRIITVRCNSQGGFGMEAPRGKPMTLAEGVTFDTERGYYIKSVRQFQTHQQLVHMDAETNQQKYTADCGRQFWSSVGSLSHRTMLNIYGFNSLLFPGLSAVQTGTNPHAGSYGYLPPRTHTYIDPIMPAKYSELQTSQRANTVWLGAAFSDDEDSGEFTPTEYPYDTSPNDAEHVAGTRYE
jgi:hypothetical protein